MWCKGVSESYMFVYIYIYLLFLPAALWLGIDLRHTFHKTENICFRLWKTMSMLRWVHILESLPFLVRMPLYTFKFFFFIVKYIVIVEYLNILLPEEKFFLKIITRYK